MSFLDNLENSLKTLESMEQGGIDESRRREAERERAVAVAPWAERLKDGPYVKALMQQSIRAGFSRRMKVNLLWIGTSLRLEARGQRLEFRPEPDRVNAVFLDDTGAEVRVEPVDLEGDPGAILARWMELLDAHRKREDEQVAAAVLQNDE